LRASAFFCSLAETIVCNHQFQISFFSVYQQRIIGKTSIKNLPAFSSSRFLAASALS